MQIAVLLLAAGQSRRFGAEDKLLAPFRGRPLVDHALAHLTDPALAGFRLRQLAVVSDPQVAALAQARGFALAPIPPGQPMAASLVQGLAQLRSGPIPDQLLVALGDMPFVQPQDFAALLRMAGTAPAACATGEVALPPALFPASDFAKLARLQGDRGAASVLRGLDKHRLLRLPPERLADIDTTQELRIAQDQSDPAPG